MFHWFKHRRRQRLLRAPWPSPWSSILTNNVTIFNSLSAEEKNKLQCATRIIISEKHWEAHEGLTMSDEIKVTIAGTAALLLLGVDGFYFDRVHTVIVFPHPVRRTTREGPIVGRESHHSGEAWQSGQVVLSWKDVVHDSRRPSNGRNVVIHEFAHCLDGLDGEMGGSLMFADPATTARWQQVCASEFAALRAARQRGQETVIDKYGTISLAEFFAVCSEAFFERPRELKQGHAELFELLVEYYCIDPRKWR